VNSDLGGLEYKFFIKNVILHTHKSFNMLQENREINQVYIIKRRFRITVGVIYRSI
jgi:hypothetical protein